MPVPTTYLHLIKPDRNELNWDGEMNGNLDELDAKAQEVDTALAGKESTANKGVANGYASLDSSGKLPLTLIPAGVGAVTSISGHIGDVILTEADIINLTVDLRNKANASDLAAKADISSLAPVATSGSYTDLSNKPTIPAAQVNSDWNAVAGLAQILNKPILATVSVTGSYTDLSDTPAFAAVATSGDYNDLLNTPSSAVNSDWNANSGLARILNKPLLAPVSISGSYFDLINQPTIPVLVTFKTNSISNGSQTVVNLKAGANVSLADDGAGGITIVSAAIAGGVLWGAVTGTLSDQTDLQTALNAKESTSNKAVAGGYAPLDGDAKVPAINLPPIGLATQLVTKTADYTTDAADDIVVMNAATAKAVTLTTTGLNSGKIVRVKNINTGAVTVQGESGNIDGLASIVIPFQYQSVDFAFDGANFWVL